MAKGYWIARMTVNDPTEYQKYLAAAAEPFQKYGAKFIIRGGRAEHVEGPGRPRNIVIEFESFDQAMECYNTPEYQAAAKIRQASATGEIVVIEGYDG
jgi:uncharacterized protein (DUF1330 family)